eukprot:203094-Amphidinium_carterae.1
MCRKCGAQHGGQGDAAMSSAFTCEDYHMGGGIVPPPSFSNPVHNPLDQWCELRMIVAAQQNARVEPNVSCKAARVRILEPHAVDDMPTGIRRDHRTD